MKLKNGQKYRIKKIDKNDNAHLNSRWNVSGILLFENTSYICFIKGEHDVWYVGSSVRKGYDYSELLEEVNEEPKEEIEKVSGICVHCGDKILHPSKLHVCLDDQIINAIRNIEKFIEVVRQDQQDETKKNMCVVLENNFKDLQNLLRKRGVLK